MPREVTAFSNTTVKRLRSLRDKKARKEEGLFLAEGLRIITEARDSGLLPEIIMFSSLRGSAMIAVRLLLRGRSSNRPPLWAFLGRSPRTAMMSLPSTTAKRPLPRSP